MSHRDSLILAGLVGSGRFATCPCPVPALAPALFYPVFLFFFSPSLSPAPSIVLCSTNAPAEDILSCSYSCLHLGLSPATPAALASTSLALPPSLFLPCTVLALALLPPSSPAPTPTPAPAARLPPAGHSRRSPTRGAPCITKFANYTLSEVSPEDGEREGNWKMGRIEV